MTNANETKTKTKRGRKKFSASKVFAIQDLVKNEKINITLKQGVIAKFGDHAEIPFSYNEVPGDNVTVTHAVKMLEIMGGASGIINRALTLVNKLLKQAGKNDALTPYRFNLTATANRFEKWLSENDSISVKEAKAKLTPEQFGMLKDELDRREAERKRARNVLDAL